MQWLLSELECKKYGETGTASQAQLQRLNCEYGQVLFLSAAIRQRDGSRRWQPPPVGSFNPNQLIISNTALGPTKATPLKL